jgi:hypothetical protein
MPLFCTGCGKEVFPGEVFCSKCGKRAVPEAEAQSPSLPIPLHQPEAAPRVEPPSHEVHLSSLYTSDWRGVCPSCKFVHTVETCSCPNDGSPLVVAFDDTTFPVFAYPLHAATIRCLNDCGFYANAISCTRCGATIKDRLISFRFPKWVARVHYAFHAANLFLLIVIGAPFLELAGIRTWPVSILVHMFDGYWLDKIVFNLFVSMFLLAVSFGLLKSFRPFNRFTFVNVKRAARRHAKEAAQRDAIATAKAVQAATKPLFKEHY